MRSDLPAGWTVRTLDELADVSWGDTATTKASYTKDGFLAFSASGPDGYLPYYDYERDGVVVSAIGANSGRVFFARERWSCIKNTIRFWGRDGVCDTRFLYYATSDPGVWPKRGSAQPFISQGDARALKLSVPTDVSEQRRIASILGALDDKIDGNRRLARRLEEITATAFCARFVDFVGVERRGSDMAVPETVDPDGQSANAIARLLATDMREDLLAIMREILERSAFAERLAYSPDEAAELLGISRELVHDLLRTGQLGSVKAGRRRLIARHHLEAFLAGEP